MYQNLSHHKLISSAIPERCNPDQHLHKSQAPIYWNLYNMQTFIWKFFPKSFYACIIIAHVRMRFRVFQHCSLWYGNTLFLSWMISTLVACTNSASFIGYGTKFLEAMKPGYGSVIWSFLTKFGYLVRLS